MNTVAASYVILDMKMIMELQLMALAQAIVLMKLKKDIELALETVGAPS